MSIQNSMKEMKRKIQITLVIDRQVAMIIGAAIGLLLIATIGVSAHAGAQPILQLAGVHEDVGDQPGDTASSARIKPTESPEPTHHSSSESAASEGSGSSSHRVTSSTARS
ncbi:MAG TPA: hypothetical protein VEW68_02290, partial [Patescibacteria group bacterium]|nr:hypothetical protein [Patescibacteria group bacterium]